MPYFRSYPKSSTPTPANENYICNIGNNGIGFNTGYKHTADTKIAFKASIDSWASPSYAQVFGARAGNFREHAFSFFGRFNYNGYALCRTGAETSGTTIEAYASASPWNMIPCIFTVVGTTASWYRADEPLTIHSIIGGGSADNGIAPMAIFGCNNSSATDGWQFVDGMYSMILYWFEIYESNTLVHRYVPAYNNDQYCLYDEVTDTYLYDVISSGVNVKGYVAGVQDAQAPVLMGFMMTPPSEESSDDPDEPEEPGEITEPEITLLEEGSEE